MGPWPDVDAGHLARIDFVLRLAIDGFIRHAELMVLRKEQPDVIGYSGHDGSTQFLWHLFLFKHSPDRLDRAGQFVNELQDILDGTWHGPIGISGLARALQPHWSMGPGDDTEPARLLSRHPLNGIGDDDDPLTIVALLRDVVFAHNATVRSSDWGVDGLEHDAGRSNKINLLGDWTKLLETIDAPSLSPDRVGPLIAELRRAAGAILRNMVAQANAQRSAAIVLGIAATVSYRIEVPGANDDDVLRSESHDGFQIFGVPVAQLWEPTASLNLCAQWVTRARNAFLDEMGVRP